MRRAILLLATAVMAPWPLLVAQSSLPGVDLPELLAQLGASIERYYARAESIICTESVLVRSLDYDMMPDRGPMRRLTYDLHIAWDRNTNDPSAVTVQRELVKLGSRAPRPKDKPACTDPTAVSPDALAMFLPGRQEEYAFSLAGKATVRKRAAIMLDYRSRATGQVSPKLTPRDGVEDCWSVDMPAAYAGRVWIDRETGDVLRLDERLVRPVDIRFPRESRGIGKLDFVTLHRDDTSTNYRPVTFADPDETLMLPASVDTISIASNMRERRSTTLSNFRRFSTGARIVQ